jgi:hypothetical protein
MQITRVSTTQYSYIIEIINNINTTLYTFSRTELEVRRGEIYSNGRHWRKYLKISQTSGENIKEKKKLNLVSSEVVACLRVCGTGYCVPVIQSRFLARKHMARFQISQNKLRNMKMLVVCKRSFRPYNDCRNPTYTQKPILSTIYKTIYIKIPVQHPFSQRDATSNALPNETQNELCSQRGHQQSTQSRVPSQSSKMRANSSCPKSTIAYHTQETTPCHNVNPTILPNVNYADGHYNVTGRYPHIMMTVALHHRSSLHTAWLCGGRICILLVATYGNSLTSVGHPPPTSQPPRPRPTQHNEYPKTASFKIFTNQLNRQYTLLFYTIFSPTCFC